MDQRTRVERLRRMLTAQGDPADVGLESLIQEVPSGDREGTEDFAGAADALRALRDGVELSPPQLEQLEAIVLPYQRPVARVRRARWDPLPGMWSHLNDEPTRARLEPVLRAVGRINIPSSPPGPTPAPASSSARVYCSPTGTSRTCSARACAPTSGSLPP